MEAGLMGNRVLVVDDHAPMVDLIEDALSRAGFVVSTASDGQQCLRKVIADKPDLVVLDVVMPGMDGYQVLRELRRKAETADIPVILLTVRREHRDVVQGWMAGASMYLKKPCSPEEVVAAVRQTLAAPARA